MTSVKLVERAEANGVQLEFIQPGKPAQDSFIERFNRTYREEVLDMYLFKRISEVREKVGTCNKTRHIETSVSANAHCTIP